MCTILRLFALYVLSSLPMYVHEMNITHRDLKPENILLSFSAPDADPVVKIADFGLAKAIRNLTMLQVRKMCLFCLRYPNT